MAATTAFGQDEARERHGALVFAGGGDGRLALG